MPNFPTALLALMLVSPALAYSDEWNGDWYGPWTTRTVDSGVEYNSGMNYQDGLTQEPLPMPTPPLDHDNGWEPYAPPENGSR